MTFARCFSASDKTKDTDVKPTSIVWRQVRPESTSNEVISSRALFLRSEPFSLAMTGDVFEFILESDLESDLQKRIINKTRVYGRMSPELKQKLIEVCGL